MPRRTIVVWLRTELRLRDNPSLYQAFEDARTVVPVFVWCPEDEGEWAPGPARRWWLARSLESLDRDLQSRGSRLVMRAGDTATALASILKSCDADALYYSRRYEPAARKMEHAIERALSSMGESCRRFDPVVLHDVDALLTTGGTPYRVFTPFWKRLSASLRLPPPLPDPPMSSAQAPEAWPASASVADLGLLADADGQGRLAEWWEASETAALRTLDSFIRERVEGYEDARDFPAADATSRLSPYLANGQLSPLQVWSAVSAGGCSGSSVDAFLRQLGWREFAYHLLHHFPRIPSEPMDEKYGAFPWRADDAALQQWQEGRTGYPIVDAAMRQLRTTGWMHNRLRMIVASFLTKDLLIPWQHGAQWFWDSLLDADLANNTLGWQWAAGSGADAQPFFRIFNPVKQGERYDRDGRFVRAWIPELRGLADRFVHQPWAAPAEVLAEAGVRLGDTYPRPMIDHASARRSALDAYNRIR